MGKGKTIKKNIEKHKQQVMLGMHPYAITEPASPDGRWQTYLKTRGRKKLIRANTYQELLDKLYDAYASQEEVYTLDDLFTEWLSYKEAITHSMKTIRRHEQHWRKYFDKLKERELSSFDRLELQKECNLLVKENHLSSKEWQNVKTILSGMFDYAGEKGYIDGDMMRKVKITVKFRQVNKKSGKEETYQTDELKSLYQYIDVEFARTLDIVLMAIRFNFFVGCRVGELVALKWTDIVNGNHLHICREEIKDSVRIDGTWKDVYTVADHTKTNKDRIVPLAPDAVNILSEVRKVRGYLYDEEDFIFMRGEKRITSRQINYALEKACTSLGMTVKRSHKIRKTVASRLYAGDVPLDFIREMLGHAELSTTLGYIFNPLSEEETYNLITKAL